MNEPARVRDNEPLAPSEAEAISYAPVRHPRPRRRRQLALLIGAAVLALGFFLSEYINIPSLLPTSLLLRLQISRFDCLWQPSTIELDRRWRAALLGAAESTDFFSNTFLLEPRAPDKATQGKAFEFGLRIVQRTPRLARALQRGRSPEMGVGTRYHLEDVTLTLEDGKPIPSGGAESFSDEILPNCTEIGITPHSYGWPVVIGDCGRFNLKLSGRLMVGCSMHVVPDVIPFSILHEVVVTELAASLYPQKATDLDLDAHIRSGFESPSWDDEGRLWFDFGSSNYLCEVEVSARPSSNEEFMRLAPVLAQGKQSVQIPQAWLAGPSWREGGSVELKATGGWTISRSWFVRFFGSGEVRWRYWDSELTRRVLVQAGPAQAGRGSEGRATQPDSRP